MILEYNLQFFAKDGPGGEKTEAPTEKKLTDSRKEGQVAKSQEVGNCVMLLALFIMLKIWIGNLGIGMMEMFSGVYNRMPELSKHAGGGADGNGIELVIRDSMGQLLIIILPVLLIAFAVAFIADLVQVKWKPTTKPLQPKLSKLNPLKGIKKIFSKRALVELLKSALKIGMIAYIVYSTLMDSVGLIYIFYHISLMQAIGTIGTTVINLGIRISLFYIVIAAADYFYQRWKFKDDMKMTKQEIKDEYKNAEGDPQIKGKIRQRMREASQRRMMQAVPQADVVITNPTHFAVALKYDPEKQDAPYVVAKGEEYLAQKIKEIARENHIEIVENKPLARMLYHNVEVGAAVPPELYQAVAEVLAMVYNIQGKIQK